MFSRKIDAKKTKSKNTKYLKESGIEVVDHLPSLDVTEIRETKFRVPLSQYDDENAKEMRLGYATRPGQFTDYWTQIVGRR